MKQYTREELTNLTKEQIEAMSQEERTNIQRQGRAFLQADIDNIQ